VKAKKKSLSKVKIAKVSFMEDSEQYFEESEYTKHEVESWKQLRDLYYGELKPEINFSLRPDEETYWIFRGEDCDKPLQTSLEKAFRRFEIPDEEKVKYEKKIVRSFQRKASLYIQHEPDKDDILEWLALMRHHGAPTRLIDWTYSFFVAVYWALAEKQKHENAAVWAFNSKQLRDAKKMQKLIRGKKKKTKNFVKLCNKFRNKDDVLGIRNDGDKLIDLAIVCYLIENPFPIVYAVNPFRLNQRLTIQQALFLICGDIEKSFRRNLKETIKPKGELKKALHKIILPTDNKERKEILRELNNMNISNAVLLPGLDGFTKSLEESLAYRHCLGEVT
jgi:hypothetical protein